MVLGGIREQKDAGYDWRKEDEEERRFLTFMNEQRGLVVHEGDTEKEVHWVYIPFSEVRDEPSRHPAFGHYGVAPPGTEEPVIGRRTYFVKNTEGQNVNVIGACRLYLKLLEKLVQDFKPA